MQKPPGDTKVLKLIQQIEEEIAETRRFCDAGNAPNLGRVEALSYALTKDVFTKGALFVWTAACGVLALTLLMALHWRDGIPEAMEVLGVLGVMPTLLGGTMMLSAFLERRTGHFLAYHQRCAPLLLAPGLLLMAFGLLGVAFGA